MIGYEWIIMNLNVFFFSIFFGKNLLLGYRKGCPSFSSCFHGIFFFLSVFISSSWSLVFLVLFYDKNYKYGDSVLGGD